jgi:hypothetical protein
VVSEVLLPKLWHAVDKVLTCNEVQVHCNYGCHKLGEEHDLIGIGCKVPHKVDVVGGNPEAQEACQRGTRSMLLECY